MATNVPNASFETVPTFVAAQTADGWIDGTATGSSSNSASGWWASPRATAIAVKFDTTKARTGSASLKVSTTDITGRARVFCVPASGGNITAATNPGWIAVQPSSTYTLTGWIQVNNCVGAVIEMVQADSTFTPGTSTASTAITGTNTTTWTQATATVTTGATTVWMAVDMQNGTAGNISDAWFDDLVLTGPGIGGTTSTHSLTLLGVGN